MLTLTKTMSVAMIANLWTSRNTDGYLRAALHWIDKDWVSKKILLGEFVVHDLYSNVHIMCTSLQ